jgi:DNA-binding CsgD family transcriptional regulator
LARLSAGTQKSVNESAVAHEIKGPPKLSSSHGVRLSNAYSQRVAMRRLKRLASSGLPFRHLVQSAIDVISDAVPTNEAAGIQMRGDTSNRLVMFRNADVARWGPSLKNLLFDAPREVSGMLPFDATRFPVGAVLRSERMTAPNFHRLPTYNEVMGPLGYHHWLVSIFEDAGNAGGLLAFPRGRDMPPFEKSDVRFLHEATPHLAHGIQVASSIALGQVVTAAAPESIVREPPGVAIITWDGRVLGLDQRARSLFQEVGQVEGLRMNAFAPRHLKESLSYVACTMRRIFRDVPGALDDAPVPVIRVLSSAAGIVLKLRAYLVEGEATDQRFFTVMVEEIDPLELFQQRVRYRYGLGRREAQVLAQLRLGTNNHEIVNRLGISSGSLKGYLRVIASKLELDGVGALRTHAHRL